MLGVKRGHPLRVALEHHLLAAGPHGLQIDDIVDLSGPAMLSDEAMGTLFALRVGRVDGRR
jgi:hypothetical protein